MKPFIIASLALAAVLLGAAQVSAKLPPPSDEAKAKAAEAAAKSAHAGKLDAYQLCKSMDKVAADYYAAAKKAGSSTTPPAATPPCVDPGPFVYVPPAAAAGAAAAAPTAPMAAATPAAPAAVAKK
jgi:hypothetical protein